MNYIFLFNRLFMQVSVVAAMIGLAWCGTHFAREDRMTGSADALDVSGIVRFEVLHLWLPRSLYELAKDANSLAVTRTHADFQRFLATRNQKDLWYAFTTRGFKHSGEISDCTYVRHPYRESLYFQELLEVLAVAAGHDSPSGMTEFSDATLTVVPDDFLERAPREAMRALLGDSFARAESASRDR